MFLLSGLFFGNYYKLFSLFLLQVLITNTVLSQTGNTGLCTGSLGEPVVNITFGNGENPGKQLSEIVAGASTTYSYISVTGNPAVPVPFDGNYTITNNVPYNPSWYSGMTDHTGDPNGYMAFYNSSEQTGQFYQQQIDNLCGSTTYEFAAWIVNALNPSRTIGMNPDITFVIEKLDGTVIASYNTGSIAQEYSFTWKQYGLFFTMPANTSSIVLKMSNNNPGGSNNVGNDLAIDDITFRPCGPSTTASFEKNNFKDHLELCFAGSGIHLYGSVSSGYNSPTYTWQQSFDSGQSWADIPNSNSLDFVYNFPATNTGHPIELRLVSADGTAINSINCRVVSNAISVLKAASYMASISADPICLGNAGSLIFQVNSSDKFNISYTDGSQTYSLKDVQNNDNISIASSLTETTSFSLLSITGTDGCVYKPSDPISVAKIVVNELPDLSIKTPLVCFGDHAKIIVNALSGAAPFSITYSDGSNTFTTAGVRDADTILTAQIPAVSGNYMLLKVRDSNGCSSNTTKNADFVVEKPVLNVAKEFNSCPDMPIQLLAAGVAKYNWEPSTGLSDNTIDNPIATLSETSNYIVTGISASGCKITSATTVNIYSNPLVQATPDTSVCPGASLALAAAGGNQYYWYPSAFVDDPYSSHPNIVVDKSQKLFVDITDVYCTYKDSVSINVLSKPSFQKPLDKEFCAGNKVQLDGANDPGLTYLWSPPTSLDNPNLPKPMASPESSTDYFVQITEPKCGFDTSFKVSVLVRKPSSLNVQKTNDIDCLNQRTQLSARPGLLYSWEPKEYLNNPTIQSPEATVNKSTIFTLTATDQYGCKSMDSVYVLASETGKGLFEVPNAFTPNGDGKNDCFGLKHWGNNTLEQFEIFNRWGEVVFETRNMQNCWDGTYKGILQPTDTYVYYIKAKTFCGNIFKKGTILLIR